MKKLFGLFLLAAVYFAPTAAGAANCFWVGGTGDINDTAHWASASGGTTGTCAAAGGWPNSTADNATFDGSSGGGTVTRNVNWTIGNFTMSAFTGTFGNSGDTATVNLNMLTNTGSATRSFNLGASTWTCGTAGTTVCNWFNAGTNQTFAANTSTLVISGSTSAAISNIQLNGAYTYNIITFNPDQSNGRGTTLGNSNGVTIGTLNIGAPNDFTFQNVHTWNITTLNFAGGSPSITSWTALMTTSIGSTATFALANPATCNYCIFRDINVTTSSITANNSINLNGNTNISISPPSVGGGGGRIIGG